MNAKPKIFALAVCLGAISAGVVFRGANDEPAPAAWNKQAAAAISMLARLGGCSGLRPPATMTLSASPATRLFLIC